MMAAAFRPAVFQPWGLSGVPRAPLGQTPPPNLTADQLAGIRKAAGAAIDALRMEIEAVMVEIDWTSPSTLRVEPDKYRQIGTIGADFSPYEIRTVIQAEARELGNLGSRIKTGPLSHYLTADQASAVDTAVSDAAKAVAYERDQDLEPVKAEHMKAADDQVQSHVANVKPLIEAAERMVVSGEAPAVQVREPGEKGVTPLGIAVGAGVVAVVGFVLWQLFG